jgi:hypothetical protein
MHSKSYTQAALAFVTQMSQTNVAKAAANGQVTLSNRLSLSLYRVYFSCPTLKASHHHTLQRSSPTNQQSRRILPIMSTNYDRKRAHYCTTYGRHDKLEGTAEAVRHAPLISLAVQCQLDENHSQFGGGLGNTSTSTSLANDTTGGLNTQALSPPVIPQYGLLGFDLENTDDDDNAEPILLNTNVPGSVFLCGSQGSGKSYTLSCMLENHLLKDATVGVQRQTIPGFVFHYDANGQTSLAEATSLCSRGIKVRVLVSWSNYQRMKFLYEDLATRFGKKIEVRPLLFQDNDLTATHILNLMSFDDSSNTPVYLGVLQGIMGKIAREGNGFSVLKFLKAIDAEKFQPAQKSMLDQRMYILKSFSATATPMMVEKENPKEKGDALRQRKVKQGVGLPGDCVTVEKGTLTIVDLSGDFMDASTACTMFDICLAVVLKRHQKAVKEKRISAGLIVTLDEAHKYLDTTIPAAEKFTSSLLTIIREQRHNSARVVIATQEPTISGRLLDLCSVSIIHRFNSPEWFKAIRKHLGGASDMITAEDDGGKSQSQADLFRRILALRVGESLVFSPTSWVHGGEVPGGGEAVEPRVLGNGVLWMKTRKREGDDAGRTMNVI